MSDEPREQPPLSTEPLEDLAEDLEREAAEELTDQLALATVAGASFDALWESAYAWIWAQRNDSKAATLAARGEIICRLLAVRDNREKWRAGEDAPPMDIKALLEGIGAASPVVESSGAGGETGPGLVT